MLSWLKFYDWVTGPDGPSPRPDRETLNNDEELDAFIDAWKESLKPKKDKTHGSSKSWKLS